MSDIYSPASAEHISLCDVLDRVLNKGVVASGEVVISVAGVDLIYLRLNALLTSVETARRIGAAHTPVERRDECI